MQGMVLDIHRSSFHDGPGIRTTVFFKGCPLRCKWCHNPESFKMQLQLSFIKRKCTKCRMCQDICTNGVHEFDEESKSFHKIRFEKCNLCGKCIEVCPNAALLKIGKSMRVEEVMSQILADKEFYISTGGGVTISGGEPLLQPDFTEKILRQCKEAGIHTCVETCGDVPVARFEQIMDVTDLFLYDLKSYHGQMQKKYTGGSYENIVRNLEYLCKQNKDIWLRCPIVPGIHDVKEHFLKILELGNTFSQIREIHLMPYHSYGNDKWEQLGMEYELPELLTATKEQKADWIEQMKGFGCNKVR